MSNNQVKALRPLWFGIMLAIGIYIGNRLDFSKPPQEFFIKNPQKDKLTQLFNYINYEYVDEVDTDSLLDETIKHVLQNLDPHSTYIPTEELQGVTENMQGSFDGIGVEFSLQKDTLVVVSAIEGGPSAKLGVKPGDRIISVEGENIAGIGLNSAGVSRRLRGERGTSVTIEVLRHGVDDFIEYTITRDKIPLVSVDVQYMLTNDVGYIKVNRFAETTYDEFSASLEELKTQGMKKLVLDLRGNPGGLMSIANEMADEFLEKDKLIVYTKNRAGTVEDDYATSKGTMEDNEVVVLIDEGSASASEIVAGALQDNDRATIIGRRSFGKGLVQQEMKLADGSAVRLTTSRYYTPTGRSIQKPYTDGIDAYRAEQFERLASGELLGDDSTVVFPDSLKFTTPKGKVVYGGGGIMPDIFVPIDTLGRTDWYYFILNHSDIQGFAFDYADRHRSELEEYTTQQFANDFVVSDELLNTFLKTAHSEVLKNKGEDSAKELIKLQLKALIARNVWGSQGFYPVLHTEDKVVQKAKDYFIKKEE